ncbi:hypothetical protein VKT23_009284 [Stygiomarasmius scandens]|uniref:F-box domain-containing protein n=1 Tax=Marasmiellus scandens TaxID=2682957 RepID=A0ABR1JJ44_9AGAR
MQHAVEQADAVYQQISHITVLLDAFNARHAALIHEAQQEPSDKHTQSPRQLDCSKEFMHMRTPTIPVLPRETIHLVFSFVDSREDLSNLALASRALHSIATSVLYRSLSLEKPRESILCLRTLSRDLRLPTLVRSFEIRWTWTKPSANLHQLVHRVLERMTLLTSLSIEVHADFHPWKLNECTFSLTRFSSSSRCDTSLVEFLEKQSNIEDLTLRGFNSDPSEFTFRSSSFNLNPNPVPFPISDTALPKLSRLRAIHAGPATVSRLIDGRPLKQVSMPLYADCVHRSLDALELSSARIERLNVISFDPEAPDYLLGEIAKRLPDLEALHVVILLAQSSEAALINSSPALRNFKSLQYLTYMSATNLGSISQENEAKIAEEWHKSCPTLKTIILPMGKVWFYDNTRWSCLKEQEG